MSHESMVYLNKVFSDQRMGSCPILTQITADSTNFIQQLTYPSDCDCGNGCGCGCGCGCGTDIDEEGSFAIESTEVILTQFDLACPTELRPSQVTVDGMAVDGLEYFNQRYMASTNMLMHRIADCSCMEKDLPTKGYFLICGAGGWRAKATIIVTGTLYGCGTNKPFRLSMTTKDDAYICIPQTSTFAAPSLCLPCATGGMAPVIGFSFDAAASLLNPSIALDSAAGQCSLSLSGCLITEPQVNLQVTRQTLFLTTAEDLHTPCDDYEKCQTCGTVTKVCGKCCQSQTPETTSAVADSPALCCQHNGCNGCNF